MNGYTYHCPKAGATKKNERCNELRAADLFCVSAMIPYYTAAALGSYKALRLLSVGGTYMLSPY